MATREEREAALAKLREAAGQVAASIQEGFRYLDRARVMGDLLRAATVGDYDKAEAARLSACERFNELTSEEADALALVAQCITVMHAEKAGYPQVSGRFLHVDMVTGKLIPRAPEVS